MYKFIIQKYLNTGLEGSNKSDIAKSEQYVIPYVDYKPASLDKTVGQIDNLNEQKGLSQVLLEIYTNLLTCLIELYDI